MKTFRITLIASVLMSGGSICFAAQSPLSITLQNDTAEDIDAVVTYAQNLNQQDLDALENQTLYAHSKHTFSIGRTGDPQNNPSSVEFEFRTAPTEEIGNTEWVSEPATEMEYPPYYYPSNYVYPSTSVYPVSYVYPSNFNYTPNYVYPINYTYPLNSNVYVPEVEAPWGLVAELEYIEDNGVAESCHVYRPTSHFNVECTGDNDINQPTINFVIQQPMVNLPTGHN